MSRHDAALQAFLPFLAYIVCRVVVIKAKSKDMRGKLYAMIKNKTLTREDNIASVATCLLLPKKFPSDIDYIISYLLFHLPTIAPVSRKARRTIFSPTCLQL